MSIVFCLKCMLSRKRSVWKLEDWIPVFCYLHVTQEALHLLPLPHVLLCCIQWEHCYVLWDALIRWTCTSCGSIQLCVLTWISEPSRTGGRASPFSIMRVPVGEVDPKLYVTAWKPEGLNACFRQIKQKGTNSWIQVVSFTQCVLRTTMNSRGRIGIAGEEGRALPKSGTHIHEMVTLPASSRPSHHLSEQSSKNKYKTTTFSSWHLVVIVSHHC